MNPPIRLQDMKVVHVNIESPFMDNSGYQETILAKCHKMICKDVTIINTNNVLRETGEIVRCDPCVYYNKDNVKIIRMDLYDKKGKKHIRIQKLYNLICEEAPDFIMVHNVFSFDVLAIAKYIRKKNRDCIVVADSHATKDNANIMNNTLKNIIYRCGIKIVNRYMCLYYKRVYGIVDDAVELMLRYGGISQNKVEILGLGYDETLIDFSNKEQIRFLKRDMYNIPQDAYVIVTGGKLNQEKRVTDLIEAVIDLSSDTHLLIFGGFSDESYKREVYEKSERIANRVHIIGNLQQKEIYDIYLASDIGVFPGTSSCLRQQAIATGLPMVIGYNEADKGINLGNEDVTIFLKENWKKEDLCNSINRIKNKRMYSINAEKFSRGEYRINSYLYQARVIIEDNME